MVFGKVIIFFFSRFFVAQTTNRPTKKRQRIENPAKQRIQDRRKIRLVSCVYKIRTTLAQILATNNWFSSIFGIQNQNWFFWSFYCTEKIFVNLTSVCIQFLTWSCFYAVSTNLSTNYSSDRSLLAVTIVQSINNLQQKLHNTFINLMWQLQLLPLRSVRRFHEQ